MHKRVEKHPMPSFVKPMLARLTEKYFSSPDWLYERKWDGERCLAFKNGGSVVLKSRNNKIITSSYPEIASAVARLRPRRAVLDGEIVAFYRGKTSFERVARRFGVKTEHGVKASGVKNIRYAVFDLPFLDGRNLDRLPLEERKHLLKKHFRFSPPLLYSDHIIGTGEQYHRQACRRGWEGIIAKRRASPYGHKRSSDWQKFKCAIGQELVIGGYTEPRGSRIGFGAVLVGYYRRGKLMYAGKVGAGFDTKELTDMLARLRKLETKKSPFAQEIEAGPGRWSHREATKIHWVSPRLVGQFAFTEWTGDNQLRHPRFLGLRRDKKPREVTKES